MGVYMVINEKMLMELMNDEETKRNITDLQISRISYFNGSLLLCDFVNLKKLEISGDFKGTLSVKVSGTSLITSLINRSSQSQNN